MAQELAGALSINRSGDGFIRIRVEDELSGSIFLDVKIGVEEFAEAVTGLSDRACVFQLRPAVVGMRSETKTELVPVNAYSVKPGEKRQYLAPFEVDGWEGRESDLGNMHKHVPQKGGGHAYSVVFHRHVPA